MRIFFALTFEEETKDYLASVRDVVANHCAKGRYTLRDNFHLTLAFIGEVGHGEYATLEEIMYQLFEPSPEQWSMGATEIAPGALIPEQLVSAQVGTFMRGNKEIVWLGVEPDKKLSHLEQNLRLMLIDEGIELEEQPFRPHITLGRYVEGFGTEDLIKSGGQVLKIRSMALMESKTVDNVLTYEVLSEVPLHDEDFDD